MKQNKLDTAFNKLVDALEKTPPQQIVEACFQRIYREMNSNQGYFTVELALFHQICFTHLALSSKEDAEQALLDFVSETQDLRQRRPFYSGKSFSYDLMSASAPRFELWNPGTVSKTTH